MIVQIQYCVDGTGGDIKSKWAVYVASNLYPSRNFQ